MSFISLFKRRRKGKNTGKFTFVNRKSKTLAKGCFKPPIITIYHCADSSISTSNLAQGSSSTSSMMSSTSTSPSMFLVPPTVTDWDDDDERLRKEREQLLRDIDSEQIVEEEKNEELEIKGEERTSKARELSASSTTYNKRVQKTSSPPKSANGQPCKETSLDDLSSSGSSSSPPIVSQSATPQQQQLANNFKSAVPPKYCELFKIEENDASELSSDEDNVQQRVVLNSNRQEVATKEAAQQYPTHQQQPQSLSQQPPQKQQQQQQQQQQLQQVENTQQQFARLIPNNEPPEVPVRRSSQASYKIWQQTSIGNQYRGSEQANRYDDGASDHRQLVTLAQLDIKPSDEFFDKSQLPHPQLSSNSQQQQQAMQMRDLEIEQRPPLPPKDNVGHARQMAIKPLARKRPSQPPPLPPLNRSSGHQSAPRATQHEQESFLDIAPPPSPLEAPLKAGEGETRTKSSTSCSLTPRSNPPKDIWSPTTSTGTTSSTNDEASLSLETTSYDSPKQIGNNNNIRRAPSTLADMSSSSPPSTVIERQRRHLVEGIIECSQAVSKLPGGDASVTLEASEESNLITGEALALKMVGLRTGEVSRQLFMSERRQQEQEQPQQRSKLLSGEHQHQQQPQQRLDGGELQSGIVTTIQASANQHQQTIPKRARQSFQLEWESRRLTIQAQGDTEAAFGSQQQQQQPPPNAREARGNLRSFSVSLQSGSGSVDRRLLQQQQQQQLLHEQYIRTLPANASTRSTTAEATSSPRPQASTFGSSAFFGLTEPRQQIDSKQVEQVNEVAKHLDLLSDQIQADISELIAGSSTGEPCVSAGIGSASEPRSRLLRGPQAEPSLSLAASVTPKAERATVNGQQSMAAASGSQASDARASGEITREGQSHAKLGAPEPRPKPKQKHKPSLASADRDKSSENVRASDEIETSATIAGAKLELELEHERAASSTFKGDFKREATSWASVEQRAADEEERFQDLSGEPKRMETRKSFEAGTNEANGQPMAASVGSSASVSVDVERQQQLQRGEEGGDGEGDGEIEGKGEDAGNKMRASEISALHELQESDLRAKQRANEPFSLSSGGQMNDEDWFRKTYKSMHKLTTQKSLLQAVNLQQQLEDTSQITVKLKSPKSDHRFSPSYYSVDDFEKRHEKKSISPTFKPRNISDYLPGQSSISQHEQSLQQQTRTSRSRPQSPTTTGESWRKRDVYQEPLKGEDLDEHNKRCVFNRMLKEDEQRFNCTREFRRSLPDEISGDPRKQYVAVQQGHDIPFRGLRKPAPQPNVYKVGPAPPLRLFENGILKESLVKRLGQTDQAQRANNSDQMFSDDSINIHYRAPTSRLLKMNTMNEYELNRIKKYYQDELESRLQRSRSIRSAKETRNNFARDDDDDDDRDDYSYNDEENNWPPTIGFRERRRETQSAEYLVGRSQASSFDGRSNLQRSNQGLVNDGLRSCQSPCVDLNRYQHAFLTTGRQQQRGGRLRGLSTSIGATGSSRRVVLFGRALMSFVAKNSRELSLQRGDLVEMLEILDHTWARVEDCQSGLQGLVPLGCIDYSVGCAVAKRDVYTADGKPTCAAHSTRDPETVPLLPMNKGEPITLIRRLSGHLYEASNTRQAVGIVRSTDLDIIKQPVLSEDRKSDDGSKAFASEQIQQQRRRQQQQRPTSWDRHEELHGDHVWKRSTNYNDDGLEGFSEDEFTDYDDQEKQHRVGERKSRSTMRIMLGTNEQRSTAFERARSASSAHCLAGDTAAQTNTCCACDRSSTVLCKPEDKCSSPYGSGYACCNRNCCTQGSSCPCGPRPKSSLAKQASRSLSSPFISDAKQLSGGNNCYQQKQSLEQQQQKQRSGPIISESAAGRKQEENYSRLCIVKYPYKPRQKDELELTAGDILSVVHECDDGWLIGSSCTTQKTGTFPGNFVEPL